MARTRLQLFFLAAGIVFSSIFVALVHRAFFTDKPETNTSINYMVWTFWSIVSAISFVTSLLLALVCLHISFVRSSKYHTISSLLLTYTYNQVARLSAVFIKRKLTQRIRHSRQTQETLLLDRLARDADTQYGKNHDFRNIKSLKDLQKLHPLTTYDHYATYVQRMANGENDILINDELLRFGITSGTTGNGKLIPILKSRMYALMSNIFMWMSAVGDTYGWFSPLQRTLMLYVNPKPTTTPSGHAVGPLQLFTDEMRIVSLMFTTPWEALSITNEFEATYIAMLFGLRDKNIGNWVAPFSSMIHKALTIVEKDWEKIVHDIATGTIDDELRIAADVRDACQKVMSPDPQRAEELRREFQLGFDGIVQRVWPHLIFLVGINTADFTERLHNGYAKGLPIFSPAFSGTEGDYGLNLWPGEEPRYVLLPHSVIYEFIPESKINDDQPATLLIDEVKKGERYEMVASTTSGFYRYRCGDVIEVVDFHYKTPVVQFRYRSGQLLNLRAEKVTELSVNEAVCHVVSYWPETRLVSWTSAECTLLTQISDNTSNEFDKGTQFYLVFIELEDGNSSTIVDDKKQQEFDEILKGQNNYYKSYRNAGTLSPPRVYIVKPGTFKAMKNYTVANTTASFNQYKVPRKLKNAHTLKLMLDARLL